MGQKYSHDPKPGDLIEIKRPGYRHWALYVGDGYVIHVTSTGESSSSFSIGSARGTKGIVKKELLYEVVGDNKWRVNNKYDRIRNPLPVEEIIKEAESWIDKEVPYNLLVFNCEHFVTMLRYSVGVSGQVRKARRIWHSITTSVSLTGALSIPALVVAAPPLAIGVTVMSATSAILDVGARLSNFFARRRTRAKLSKKVQKKLL